MKIILNKNSIFYMSPLVPPVTLSNNYIGFHSGPLLPPPCSPSAEFYSNSRVKLIEAIDMGRKSCIIRHCRFLRAGPGEVVTVHRFPACPVKRQPWMTFVEHCNGISLDGVSWMNCYLCSRHFLPQSLTKPGPGRRVRPGHNPRLMITSCGGYREFIPKIPATAASNSIKEEDDIMDEGGLGSEQSNSEAEPESIWCHPLLEGMDCSHESMERSEMDQQNVAAENDDLKEKLRATEQIFDSCHRSLKEKETIIQELREMVKMKQRKVKRLEDRIAQLESNQVQQQQPQQKPDAATTTVPNNSQAANVPTCSSPNPLPPSNENQQVCGPADITPSECHPVIVELLQKLCSLSPSYHELVIGALNKCVQPATPTVSEKSDVEMDDTPRAQPEERDIKLLNPDMVETELKCECA